MELTTLGLRVDARGFILDELDHRIREIVREEIAAHFASLSRSEAARPHPSHEVDYRAYLRQREAVDGPTIRTTEPL